MAVVTGKVAHTSRTKQYIEQKLTPTYMALLTDLSGTEVEDPAYERQEVKWVGDEPNLLVTNLTEIEFPEASKDYGWINGIALFNHPTSSKQKPLIIPFSNPQWVSWKDRITIGPGQVVFHINALI